MAANPSVFIEEIEAKKNIEMSIRVIQECKRSSSIKRIINASSINVYPYTEIFEKGEKITNKTLLSPSKWGDGAYGGAKIEVEKLFEHFCKEKKISLINLRLGVVTKDNLLPRQEDGRTKFVEYDIYLKHEDLVKVIKNSLDMDGILSYLCASKRDGFIDESINFPL